MEPDIGKFLWDPKTWTLTGFLFALVIALVTEKLAPGTRIAKAEALVAKAEADGDKRVKIYVDLLEAEKQRNKDRSDRDAREIERWQQMAILGIDHAREALSKAASIAAATGRP